jgi:hypothetical protein
MHIDNIAAIVKGEFRGEELGNGAIQLVNYK